MSAAVAAEKNKKKENKRKLGCPFIKDDLVKNLFLLVK